MEVYQQFSKVTILTARDEELTLNLWKCFSDERNRITTYCISSEYYDTIISKGKLSKDNDYFRFLSYLRINTDNENWNRRYGQVISEEERSDEFGDYYSVYKFHYTVQTDEGDILHIIPFDPIGFYLQE